MLAFVDELGLKAKPTPTGTPPATLTAVMSGQIDIGWSAPPIAVREISDGRVRILARGSAAPSLRDQTVRATVINADLLRRRPDVAARFMAAYRETVDSMYADPKAVELYAKKIDRPAEFVRDTIREFYPKEALQTERMADMPGILRDAVEAEIFARTAERRPAQGADPHAAAVVLTLDAVTETRGVLMRVGWPRRWWPQWCRAGEPV